MPKKHLDDDMADILADTEVFNHMGEDIKEVEDDEVQEEKDDVVEEIEEAKKEQEEEKQEEKEEEPKEEKEIQNIFEYEEKIKEEPVKEEKEEKEFVPPRKKENNGFSTFMLMVLSFIVGGIAMIGIIQYTPLLDELGVDTKTSNTVVTKNETQVYEKNSLAASVEKIYDAVATVRCYTNTELSSTGTGFVYKTDKKYGYILTNAHVVNDQEKVTITFNNSDEEVDAEVLGKDSYLDLAVLRVDVENVTLVANIGNSEKINIGDTVFTVGAPMGYEYRGSVTSGVLSGKDRMIKVSVGKSNVEDWVMRVLQLDASINPGNSGGPLLNANGEVIGICSLKLVDDQIEGMGFAIPIEYAMNHVEQLENGEKIEWPVIGITMANVNETSTLSRNGISLSSKIKEGVVIVSTQDESAASKAGLKKGDVITKLAGQKVKDIAYLRYELYQHSAGDEIDITYIRNGKEYTVSAKLGKSSD